jgi:tRNA(Arg) A34 adenosine deaminase TadA
VSARAAWAELAPAWQECFRLAWESFQEGSVPVGAVLVSPSGAVVRTGRNRRDGSGQPLGELAGTNLAHAELNALATLPFGVYTDHVLYTTLEPCLLCTAAIRYSHIGTVRFAAADPLWYGMDRLPEINHHIARWWPVREGPLDRPWQTWAAVLHLFFMVERGSQAAIETYAETMPGELDLARRLVSPSPDALRAMSLPEALDKVWAEL